MRFRLLIALLKLYFKFDFKFFVAVSAATETVEDLYPEENSGFKRARAQKLVCEAYDWNKDSRKLNLYLELALLLGDLSGR